MTIIWFCCAALCSAADICTLLVEPNQGTGTWLHLAEVRLFSSAGLQYSSNQLTITMSSISPDWPPARCMDGDENTFFHSTSDRNQWLRITYQCKDGLSKVEVVNRLDCCRERITFFRMRALAADGVTDLATPYIFPAAQAYYLWQLSGSPIGEAGLGAGSICMHDACPAHFMPCSAYLLRPSWVSILPASGQPGFIANPLEPYAASDAPCLHSALLQQCAQATPALEGREALHVGRLHCQGVCVLATATRRVSLARQVLLAASMASGLLSKAHATWYSTVDQHGAAKGSL